MLNDVGRILLVRSRQCAGTCQRERNEQGRTARSGTASTPNAQNLRSFLELAEAGKMHTRTAVAALYDATATLRFSLRGKNNN